VARYLAGALEKNDRQLCDRLLSNDSQFSPWLETIALCGLGIVAWQLPHLFDQFRPGWQVNSALDPDPWLVCRHRVALSAYTGVLIGMQRNEFPAIALRPAGYSARSPSFWWSIIPILFCMAGAVYWRIQSRCQFGTVCDRDEAAAHAPIQLRLPERAMAAELFRYCSTLSVWTFAMLLISGLDVISRSVQLSSGRCYSLAATLICSSLV